MKHRVVLARQEGIDADARFRRELAEALALELVRDEYEALVLGKLFQSGGELVQSTPRAYAASGPASGEGSRSSSESKSPSSSSGVARVKLDDSGLFLRNRSMIRLRATRKSQAPTCSMGFISRYASTSSKKTSCSTSSTSRLSGRRLRMKLRSRPCSRSIVSAISRSCSLITCSSIRIFPSADVDG